MLFINKTLPIKHKKRGSRIKNFKKDSEASCNPFTRKTLLKYNSFLPILYTQWMPFRSIKTSRSYASTPCRAPIKQERAYQAKKGQCQEVQQGPRRSTRTRGRESGDYR